MASLMQQSHLENAFKSHVPRCPAKQRRAMLLCKAQAREGWIGKSGPQLLAAGLAATVLIATPQSTHAGVVFESQPKLKRAFQKSKKAAEEAAPSQTEGSGGSFSLPALPSLPAPSLPSLPSLPTPSVSLPGLPQLPEVNTSGGIDPRTVALPGAILGITGLGFAAYTLDGGFRSMMKEGLVKDSTGYAGYEEEVDKYASQATGAAGRGTKKIAKTIKGAAGKAKGKGKGKEKGGLFGIFN